MEKNQDSLGAWEYVNENDGVWTVWEHFQNISLEDEKDQTQEFFVLTYELFDLKDLRESH